MLVLTRKREEVVVINKNVVVRIIEIRKGAVRLGISAPPDVPIARGEIATEPFQEKRRHLPVPGEAVEQS